MKEKLGGKNADKNMLSVNNFNPDDTKNLVERQGGFFHIFPKIWICGKGFLID